MQRNLVQVNYSELSSSFYLFLEKACFIQPLGDIIFYAMGYEAEVDSVELEALANSFQIFC